MPITRFPKGLYNPCFFRCNLQGCKSEAMKKGAKVLGLIVILMIIGSVFVGVVTAESSSEVGVAGETDIGDSTKTIGVSASSTLISTLSQSVHNINTGESFSTIQAAIDDSDTLDV